VLEGRVEVTLLDHRDILNPGDSIYYDSMLPHIVACHGDKPAKILAVIYAKREMIIL
jgi:quercetin dioxygenase-like cupin family protein